MPGISVLVFFTLLFADRAFATDTDVEEDSGEVAVDTDLDGGEGAAWRAGEQGGMDCSAIAAGWGGALAASVALVGASVRRRRG